MKRASAERRRTRRSRTTTGLVAAELEPLQLKRREHERYVRADLAEACVSADASRHHQSKLLHTGRPSDGCGSPRSPSAEAPRNDHALIFNVDIDARAVANASDDQIDQLLRCKAAGLQAHRGKAHGLAATCLACVCVAHSIPSLAPGVRAAWKILVISNGSRDPGSTSLGRPSYPRPPDVQ